MIGAMEVSRLSLGCAPLANLYSAVDPDVAAATVHAALDAGITYFDPAPHDGGGLSETRVGEALRGVPRSSFRISTKVGRLLMPGDNDAAIFADAPAVKRVFDFSADGVTRRARRQCVDVRGDARLACVRGERAQFLHDVGGAHDVAARRRNRPRVAAGVRVAARIERGPQ